MDSCQQKCTDRQIYSLSMYCKTPIKQTGHRDQSMPWEQDASSLWGTHILVHAASQSWKARKQVKKHALVQHEKY